MCICVCGISVSDLVGYIVYIIWQVMHSMNEMYTSIVSVGSWHDPCLRDSWIIEFISWWPSGMELLMNFKCIIVSSLAYACIYVVVHYLSVTWKDGLCAWYKKFDRSCILWMKCIQVAYELSVGTKRTSRNSNLCT